MKSQRLTIAIVCLLAVVLAAALWGADLNIKGNVNVEGDGSRSARGNLKVNGDIIASKYYLNYNVTNGLKNLGPWDVCFLSGVTARNAGIPVGDICKIDPPEAGVWVIRPSWELSASEGITCSAICLSFSVAKTGQ